MSVSVIITMMMMMILLATSHAASIGSVEAIAVNPSKVIGLEQSTEGLSTMPTPSPMVTKKVMPTPEIERDLQLITLPESKYVHAVKIQEGEYFLASNGDPGPNSIFAVERYTNTQSNGPSYHYRMRRKGTKEYLYIEDDRLLLGVETEDRVPAMFERIEHTAQLYTYISMRSLDSNGERTSCYVGFDSSHHGICTTPNERKYFLEHTPYNNIG